MTKIRALNENVYKYMLCKSAQIKVISFILGLTLSTQIIAIKIQGKFPGVASTKISDSLWKINVPEELKIGHEAHFGQVTSNFLTYLEKEELPVWEVPNMISKYYTTIEAYKMAQD